MADDAKKITIVFDDENYGFGRGIARFFRDKNWTVTEVKRLIDIPEEPEVLLVLGWFELYSEELDRFPGDLPRKTWYLQTTPHEGLPKKQGITIINYEVMPSAIYESITA